MPSLTQDEAAARLANHDHGILCTVHVQRGVDAVPVVYSVNESCIGVPVDRTKPKASMRLQRERNLENDARAMLLIDHWDRNDWSQLWWVRAELSWQADSSEDVEAALSAGLVDRYPQYHEQSFERILTFQIVGLSGWTASSI